MRSRVISCVRWGESPPFFTAWGFVTFEAFRYSEDDPAYAGPSRLRSHATTPVQPGPSHPEDDPASAGPSRRRSYGSLRVRLGILLARGVILLLLRGVVSRTIRLPMRARRLLIADNGTISRMTRNIFVMLLWLFCWPTS